MDYGYVGGLDWEVIGPGPGGASYGPAIAPDDPGLMYSFTDMGGFYRSADGGRTWKMLRADQVQYGTGYHPVCCNPVFNPHDGGICFAGAYGGLRRTLDGGVTWKKVWGDADDRPTAIAINEAATNVVFHATYGWRGTPGVFLFKSVDGGDSWGEITSWRNGPGRIIDEIFIDASSVLGSLVIFVATPDGIYKTSDGGGTWKEANEGLPGSHVEKHYSSHYTVPTWIFDFAGAMKAGRPVLYATVPTRLDGERLVGGFYRSDDGGESWQQKVSGLSVRQEGEAVSYEAIGVCGGNPDVVYLGSHENEGPTVYKSTDGGESWRMVLTDPGAANFPEGVEVGRDWEALEYGWAWGEEPHEIAVCAGDADVVAFTNDGRTWRSETGGESWYSCNCTEREKGSNWWKTTGLSGSTTYRVVFDPHDVKRRFILYSDNGLQRSEDGGEYWRLSIDGSPWSNTFYAMAFDREVEGRVWACAANKHDIPQERLLRRGVTTFPGGVVMSDDGGRTWRDVGHETGLPGGAPTSVVIDYDSPRDLRTLYVTVVGSGVWKSSDAGATWKAVNNGLCEAENRNAWQLKMLDDGTLLCAVTLAVDEEGVRHSGGLFRSSDGGGAWTMVNRGLELPYICGFNVDPRDASVIYLCSRDCGDFKGGAWKSSDGGASWKNIFDAANVYTVDIDPENPDRIFAVIHQGDWFTDVGGVWMSEDGGETFVKLPGFPFERMGPYSVSFHPEDSRRIYVATFGGDVFETFVPRGGA